MIDWAARLERPAQSVDQRVKMPRWMEELERRGGQVELARRHASPTSSGTRSEYDLVIVAAGKGEIAQLFERDASRSPYGAPQRALALTYVTGMSRARAFSAVAFNLIPDGRRVLRVPGADHRRARARSWCSRASPAARWTAGATSRRRRSISSGASSCSRRSCRGRRRAAGDVELTDDERHPRRTFPADRAQADRRAAVGRAGARPGGRGRAQRPDHGSGLQQREQGCRVLPREHPGEPRGAVRRAWMQQTFDAYWDYAPVRHDVDERAARAAAAARARAARRRERPPGRR